MADPGLLERYQDFRTRRFLKNEEQFTRAYLAEE